MSIDTFEKALHDLPETSGRRFFVRRDFPLSRVTSFRIGGNADLAVYPADAEAIAYALDVAVREGVPYTVIAAAASCSAASGQTHPARGLRARSLPTAFRVRSAAPSI